MNSVERIAVTPIQSKNSGAESVVRLQSQAKSASYQAYPLETPSPHPAPIPTPSMDMSMVTGMLDRMEARLNSAIAAQQKSAQASMAASVTGAALGVLQAISIVLAVRVLLLLTLSGGFFLSVLAMDHQTAISVFVLMAYSLLVILPVAAIEHGRKIHVGGQNG